MTIIQTTKALQPRRQHDFYETPIELCRAALRKFISPSFMGNILDPGCGNGNWGRAIVEYLPKNNYYLAGVDIRSVNLPLGIYDDFEIGDYLSYRNQNIFNYQENTNFHGYDLIIDNPPYKYSEEFIRQSFDLLKEDGLLVFLLPLAFLEGIKRGRGLYKEFPPVEVAVSMRRVSFWGDGKSDNTAYGIYFWTNNWHGPTFLDWLDWDYEKQA